MKRLALMFAICAVLAPIVAAQAPVHAQSSGVNLSTQLETGRELGFGSTFSLPVRPLQQAQYPDVVQQVRIESRVIIRISPSPPAARQRLLARLPRRANQQDFEEVEHTDCVEIEDISGVASTQDNRLLLFMENRQVLAAGLERGCTARAFYSGFYVESNDDGRLCIARDRLQSRAGASCQIDALTRLVAVGE